MQVFDSFDIVFAVKYMHLVLYYSVDKFQIPSFNMGDDVNRKIVDTVTLI